MNSASTPYLIVAVIGAVLIYWALAQWHVFGLGNESAGE